jgi:hypothetical protein
MADGHEPARFRSTKPGLCGCLAGAGFLLSLSVPLMFVLAWSGNHCAPVPQCQRDNEAALAPYAAGAVALAILFGLAVASLARWAMLRAHDPAMAGRRPLWAVAVLIALGLIAVFFGWPFVLA